jgi:putative ABC transport system permease protein
MKLALLILKNLRRNPLRAGLTTLAIVFLVAILSLIGSVLLFLHRAMTARAADVPVVLTERYRFPSRFDRAFLEQIVSPGTEVNRELSYVPGFHPENYTLWHFIGFSTDPEMKDRDQLFFVIATIPEKIPVMIDDLGSFDPQLPQLMKKPPGALENTGILMGPDRLKKINKKVGDTFTAKSISHKTGTVPQKPIEMEFKIIGALPSDSRWSDGAFMDYAYLDRVLKKEQNELDGKIMLGWLKFDDQDSANRGSAIIEKHIKEIKSEIASTAVSRFLEPYKPMLGGVEYLLVPAIVVIMVLLVANAISITVRERTREIAVLKVLGFRPGQILALVLGEGLLLGALAGFVGAAATYFLVNRGLGGVRISIGFFPIFFISGHALWCGPLLGAVAALVGGLIPAMNAQNIRVSEVFAKTA